MKQDIEKIIQRLQHKTHILGRSEARYDADPCNRRYNNRMNVTREINKIAKELVTLTTVES